MKNVIKSLTVLAIVFAATAFTTPIEKMMVKESTITWVGKKITGQHTGSINLKEGYLEMKGDKIAGGKFVIDMTSLTVTDLKEGRGKEKLEGHLKSDDFFGIKNHPTSTLVIAGGSQSGNTYKMEGSITIKGVTQPISFDLSKNGNEATAKLAIDRTKFGVEYGSGSIFKNLGDKAINDVFELDVNLKF